MEPTPENIVAFWDDRAEEFGKDRRANTPDPWINCVERTSIGQILAGLTASSDILDVGCANGYSTFLLHEAFPQHRFVGGDLSQKMIAQAKARLCELPPEKGGNLRFEAMDMLDLGRFQGSFDVVITMRALLNLPNSEAQWQAIGQIAGCLRPGGQLIAIENFRNSQEKLNSVRRDLGLSPLPYRWHNCWFEESEFLKRCSEYFKLVAFEPIASTYYLVTRVVYSKMCQLEGREPDYDHPIYEIATKMPAVGDYGPIKLSHWIKSK